MKKYIMQGRKMGKVKAKIFCLCELSIRKMTMYFAGLWLAIQGIFVSVELFIWGETFQHYGDSIVTFILSSAYIYYSYELGDFLLDLVLNVKEAE